MPQFSWYYFKFFIRTILGVGILVFLIFFLTTNFPMRDILLSLQNFPLHLLLLLILLSIVISLFKGLRFALLLHTHDIHIPLLKVLRLFVASQASSAFPGGETLRGWLVYQESKEEVTRIASPVIFQALYELAGALFIVILGCFFFPDFIPHALLAFALLAGIVLALVFSSGLTHALRHFPRVFQRLQGPFHILATLRHHLLHQPAHWTALHITLAMINNLILGIMFFIIFKGFIIEASISAALLAAAVGVVLQIVGGITPGGIGITEGGLWGVFDELDIESHNALLAIFLFRLSTLGISLLLGVCVFTIWYGKTFLKKAFPTT